MASSIIPTLDPEDHTRTTRLFLDHFRINRNEPTIELLLQVNRAFSTIPYENISKIIKYQKYHEDAHRIRLPEEVMESFIQYNLGGTCFSLTFTLHCILSDLSYLSYPVMANMRYGPNTHCAMIVVIQNQKYLVDPGYLLNQPLALSKDSPRCFNNEFSGVELQFQKADESYKLNTFNQTERKWRYSFRDEPTSPQDFLSHWLASFQWNSMHGLCLTKVSGGKMIYVHKHFMRETDFVTKKNYNLKNNYHAMIQKMFGIQEALVEEALAALKENMRRERELGLRAPKKQRRAHDET